MKKAILAVILAALTLASLASCSECSHQWTDASCSYLSKCTLCAESRGGLTDEHNYEGGFCTLCKQPSDDTREAIVSSIKAIFVNRWVEVYNDREPMVEPAQVEANLTELKYSDGLVHASATLFLKMQSEGFFTCNSTLTLESGDEGYTLAEGSEPDWGTAVELDPWKKYAIYHFNGTVTLTYKTENGQERTSLRFEKGKVTRSSYDKDGALVSETVMDYIMRRTPDYNIVIMSDDVYERRAIFKNGEGLTEDGKLYILDNGS